MDNLKQLFAECDTNNKGSLGRTEFSELCTKIGLNKEAAEETFDRLDIDKNGCITFDEFATGFNQYKKSSNSHSPTKPKQTKQQQAAGDSPNQQRSPSPLSSSALSSPTQSQSATPSNQHKLASTSKQSSASSTKSGARMNRNQKLSGSPVSSLARNKNASPLGVLSLGSAGSSSNLTGSGGTRSASSVSAGGFGTTLNDGSSEFNSVDTGSCFGGYSGLGGGAGLEGANKLDNMVVYSSDAIGADYDQASGSGQFGSLMSSGGGSFSQLRNMQDLLESVQKLQTENQILSQIFFRDKREREEYISQLGEEFDLQVREVEERANRRAKEELENEKKRLREMMQTERETLQHHYQTIEKMSKLIKSSNGKLDDGDGIEKVKSKLEDTYLENRQLKKSLLDTKTDVAMIWKEMERLKAQYEDKLSNAYQRNNETRNECDHIKQQLSLMKDSNRKLQDASDVITNYITDKVEPVIKGAASSSELDDSNYLSPNGGLMDISQSSSRKGSLLSEYLNGYDRASSIDGYDLEDQVVCSPTSGNHTRNEDIEGRLSIISSSTKGERDRNAPQINVSHLESSTSQSDVIHNQNGSNNDARLSTNEDALKKSASFNQARTGKDQAVGLRNSLTSDSISGNSLPEPREHPIDQEVTTPVDFEGSEEASQVSKTILNKSSGSKKGIGRHFFIGSRSSSDSPSNRTESIKRAKSISLKKFSSLDCSIEPSDGPAVATFNIILVGDSFVGKSSFAARFMEGSFVQGLISNCSIDFKTKTYKVDGVNYTVNLWDTA